MKIKNSISTNRVSLKPLDLANGSALYKTTLDLSWDYFPWKLSNSVEFDNWMRFVSEQTTSGNWYPFVIIDSSLDVVIGSTSFLNIHETDQRLEIGCTWLSKTYHGSGVNAHCKFLLLQCAFEELNMKRVESKTDALNHQSRKALLKIGAKEEGVLRSHSVMSDGRRRDAVYYSILENEWPEVKQRLLSQY